MQQRISRIKPLCPDDVSLCPSTASWQAWLPTNCGAEATQNAIKIARIKTGRSSQKAFERDLGTVIYDEMAVYEAIQMQMQMQSLKYCWPTVNI